MNSMSDDRPSAEALLYMSSVSRRRLNSLNHFARLFNLSVFRLYFYVAFGALNIEEHCDGHVIYSPIGPTEASKILGYDRKKVSRWCAELAEKGLLTRGSGGGYQITDVFNWYEMSKLVSCSDTVSD